jgi:hypothetical protein
MRRKRKFALWGAAFTCLLALGAVTAAITAGAAPFGAQATTTVVTTITTNSSTIVDRVVDGVVLHRHDGNQHDHHVGERRR